MQTIAPIVKQELDKIPDRDRTFMRVTFKVIDRNAAGDAVFNDSGHLFYSYLPGLTYETSIPKRTYATFEKGRMKADGSQLVASKDWLKQGYVSDILTEADGKFADPPYIHISFRKDMYYSCPALTFAFDATTGDYPAALDVEVYRDGQKIETVTVNPDNYMYVHYHKFINFNSLRIVFKSMGKPYYRARLQYIEFGARIVFTNDDIINTRQVMDVDPLQRRLNENTFEFSIINMDGLYNPANPEGIYEFLEDQLPIKVEYGQYCRGGMTWEDAYMFDWENFAAMDWQQVYDGGFYGWMSGGQYVLTGDPQITDTKATFKAQDRLSDLTGDYVMGEYHPEGISLYDLAVDILEDADIPKLYEGVPTYILDNGLKSIYTTAPMPKLPHRECIQLIANAARMVAYTDRDGFIRIEPINDTQYEEEVRFDTITSEVTTEKIKPIAGVQVNISKYLPDEEESELHKDDYEAGEYMAEFNFATDIRVINCRKFTVKAKNAAGESTKEYTMAVTTREPPKIISEELNDATADEDYTYTLEYTGSRPAAFWVSEGSLPDGLSLSRAGVISGRPVESTYKLFTIACSNDAGETEKQFSLLVEPFEKPQLGSTSLPDAVVGREYSAQVEGSGRGTLEYRLLSAEDILPAGLTMGTGGYISGVPAEEGSKSFTVEVSSPDGADTKRMSISVKTEAETPEISTSSVKKGKVGEYYTAQLTARGTPPYTYAIVSGSLPAGLALNNDTGEISGTPSQTDNATFTVRVSDKFDAGKISTKDFTLLIEEMDEPKISSKEIPNGVKGQAYKYKLDAGVENAVYSIAEGTLPLGLALSADGVISGTPLETGIGAVKHTSGAAWFEVVTPGEVCILGKKLETSTEQVTILSGEEGEPETIDNSLITDKAAAQKLAAFSLDYLRLRITCDFKYRGQPNIDCTDIIYSQTRYDEKFPARVLKHNIVFNTGALSGEMTVKRMDEK